LFSISPIISLLLVVAGIATDPDFASFFPSRRTNDLYNSTNSGTLCIAFVLLCNLEGGGGGGGGAMHPSFFLFVFDWMHVGLGGGFGTLGGLDLISVALENCCLV